MRCIAILLSAVAMACLAAAPIAHAQTSPSVTYTYDARGRLTSATYSGGVNNGLVVTYSYDAAGNRTAYRTTSPFVVVPLNGVSLIMLGR